MDTIERTIERIEPLDEEAMKKAKNRQDNLTKPIGSLGLLEDLSVKLAGITRNPMPRINSKAIITMAGDHGIVESGIGIYPQDVTAQMVYNFLSGGAAINVFARHVGAKVIVVDMGVKSDIRPAPESHQDFIVKKIGYGTKNMEKEPAMTRKQAIRSIKAGIEIFEEIYKRGCDVVGTGDMGIGNTSPSTAITAVFTGLPVSKVCGRGTGIDDEKLKRKIEAIENAIELHKPDPADPIDVLSKVGGFEIGGICGVVLSACANHVPVVVDGFISGVGALIASKLHPEVKNYLIIAHKSAEPGHSAVLNELGLSPLLNFNMRLGEGTGAALGISIVEASAKILTEMKTFEEAGVSKAKGE